MSTTAAHYAPHQHHALHSMPHYERLPGVDSLLANTADRGNGLSVNSNQNHHYREQPHGKQPFHRHSHSGAPGSAALASPHAQQLQTPPLSAGAELNRSPTMSSYGHSQKQDHHGSYMASAHLPSRMVQHQDSPQSRVREDDHGRTQTSANPNVSPRQIASRQPPSRYTQQEFGSYSAPHSTATPTTHPSTAVGHEPPPGPHPGYSQYPAQYPSQRHHAAANLPTLQTSTDTRVQAYPSPVSTTAHDRWEPRSNGGSSSSVAAPPTPTYVSPQHLHPQPGSGVTPPQTSHQPHHSMQMSHVQQHPQSHLEHPYHHRSSSSLIPPNEPSLPPPIKEEYAPRLPESIYAVVDNCGVLYQWTTKFAQLQANHPDTRPPEHELAEMVRRANDVVKLLEDLRRLYASGPSRGVADASGLASAGDERPPKRPWEDISKHGDSEGGPYHEDDQEALIQEQLLADQDMEEIRNKRANIHGDRGGHTQARNAEPAGGALKNKYRKRSRTNPPGKCHSCGQTETPEWRRGPDGARTLCNACGLHYAKLVRKRTSQLPAGAPVPPIDMETLRNAARTAELAKAERQMAKNTRAIALDIHKDMSSPDVGAAPVGPTHTSTFHVNDSTSSPASASDSSRGNHSPESAMAPPPVSPWAHNAHGYAQDAQANSSMQHHSFMAHSSVSQTSPR